MKNLNSFFNAYDKFVDHVKKLAPHNTEYASLYARLQSSDLAIAQQTLIFTVKAPDGGGEFLLTPDGGLINKGVRSLAGNELAKGQFFMPVALQLLAASGVTGDTDADLLGAAFESIDNLDPAAANGELYIENESKAFVKGLALHSFLVDLSDMPYLVHTRVFKENSKNIIRLSGMPAVADTAYKLIVHGIGTNPS